MQLLQDRLGLRPHRKHTPHRLKQVIFIPNYEALSNEEQRYLRFLAQLIQDGYLSTTALMIGQTIGYLCPIQVHTKMELPLQQEFLDECLKNGNTLSTLFGQWAIEGGAKVVNNLDVYQKALDMVNDPSLYTGSMEREFIIKAGTSGAVDTMMANAFQALKIDVGTAFLPAKKEIAVSMIGFINHLRNMPELGQIAGQLATIFSQGVKGAGEALQQALPYIQQALDYLLNHGPQVVSVLKTLAGAFLTMQFAPGITGLLGGAGNLLLGAKSGAGNYATRTGGLAGLWKGGRSMAGQAGDLFSAFGGAA